MNREEMREELRLLIRALRAQIGSCRLKAATETPYWEFLLSEQADVLEERKEYFCEQLELLELDGNDSPRREELKEKVRQQNWELWEKKWKRILALSDEQEKASRGESPKEQGIPWAGPAIGIGRLAEKLYNEQLLPKSVTSPSAAIEMLCFLFVIDGKHPDPENIRKNLATEKDRMPKKTGSHKTTCLTR